MTRGFEREVLTDGSVRLSSGDTVFVFKRPRPAVLVVTIAGYDDGRLGTAPLDEIGAVLRVAAPIELFVDARNAIGATVRVSEDWTSFIARNSADLAGVHVLAGSKMVELTVAIARHLSRTDRMIEVYSDPKIFEMKLAAACKPGRKSKRKE